MIYGGSHLEWPPDNYDEHLHRLERMVDMTISEQDYEEWCWKNVLADGPPQSDDLTWVKKVVMNLSARVALEVNDMGNGKTKAEALIKEVAGI